LRVAGPLSSLDGVSESNLTGIEIETIIRGRSGARYAAARPISMRADTAIGRTNGGFGSDSDILSTPAPCAVTQVNAQARAGSRARAARRHRHAAPRWHPVQDSGLRFHPVSGVAILASPYAKWIARRQTAR